MKFWNLFVEAGLANGFGKKGKTNAISDSLSLYFTFIPWSMVLEFLNIAGFQCHATQNRSNKNQNHSTDKVQNLGNEGG